MVEESAGGHERNLSRELSPAWKDHVGKESQRTNRFGQSAKGPWTQGEKYQ